jgi:hypothetical protein
MGSKCQRGRILIALFVMLAFLWSSRTAQSQSQREIELNVNFVIRTGYGWPWSFKDQERRWCLIGAMRANPGAYLIELMRWADPWLQIMRFPGNSWIDFDREAAPSATNVLLDVGGSAGRCAVIRLFQAVLRAVEPCTPSGGTECRGRRGLSGVEGNVAANIIDAFSSRRDPGLRDALLSYFWRSHSIECHLVHRELHYLSSTCLGDPVVSEHISALLAAGYWDMPAAGSPSCLELSAMHSHSDSALASLLLESIATRPTTPSERPPLWDSGCE